jgi:hypothetical protein
MSGFRAPMKALANRPSISGASRFSSTPLALRNVLASSTL